MSYETHGGIQERTKLKVTHREVCKHNLKSMQIHLHKLTGRKMYLNKNLCECAIISLSAATVCSATSTNYLVSRAGVQRSN